MLRPAWEGLVGSRRCPLLGPRSTEPPPSAPALRPHAPHPLRLWAEPSQGPGWPPAFPSPPLLVLFGKRIKHIRHRLMKLSVMTALLPKLPPTSLILSCLLSVLRLLFGLDSPPCPAPAPAAHPAKGHTGGRARGSQGLHRQAGCSPPAAAVGSILHRIISSNCPAFHRR